VVFWIVTPYRDMVEHRRFGELCCLQLQCEGCSRTGCWGEVWTYGRWSNRRLEI